jgi:hypothetical protein
LKRNNVAKYVALAIAIALIAAACGDDKETTTTPAATAAPGATAAATGTCDASKPTIKVGNVTTAQNYAGMEDAIIARIERENKTCIGGRKLEFVGSRDDAGDIQKNLDGAKDLVENKKANLLLITSDRNVQTNAYLAGQKVPYFGWGFMPGFCGADAWGLGVQGCLSGFAFNKLGAVKLDKPPLSGGFIEAHQAITGKKDYTLVVLQEDSDAGRAGGALYDQLFTKDKVLLANEYIAAKADGSIDPAVLTKYVQLVNDKKPDMVMLSTPFSMAISISVALKSSGYKGAIQNFVAYAPGLLESSADLAAAFEGTYTITQYPPIEDGGGDAIKADLAAAGKKDFVTLGAMIGWWNTDLAIAMAKQVKGDITGEAIRKVALDGFTYAPTKGPQVKYPQDFSAPGGGPCRAVVKVENKAYKLVDSYKCFATVPSK